MVLRARVRLGKVRKGELLQRVTIAGDVVPNRRTLVTAPYNGYIRKLHVKTGDVIRPGDPIVSVTQSLLSSDPVFPLRAPFAGTVVHLGKAEGEYVREADSENYIVRIDDLSRLFIHANAPEIDRVKIKVGQEVVIKASAILSRSYKGVVRELSLAAKEKEKWGRSQVEFPVRLEVLDADSQLSPGMSVVIDIIANKKENVMLLGHEYVRNEKDKYFVHLRDGTRAPVEIGLQNEEAFEIKSGLSEGQEVRQIDFSELAQTTE